jgi:hypothetical protein
MREGVSSSETLDDIYQTTRRNILEDSHFHTRRHTNLKSHHSDVTFRKETLEKPYKELATPSVAYVLRMQVSTTPVAVTTRIKNERSHTCRINDYYFKHSEVSCRI